MAVSPGCRGCLAALLIGLATASSALGEEPARAAQGVTSDAEHALKRKLKAERARPSTTRRPVEKPRSTRPGTSVLARSDGSVEKRDEIAAGATSLDGFSIANPQSELTLARPNETARTNIEWQHPSGELWSRGLWSQHGMINSNVVAPEVKLDISGSQLDVARDANAQISELGFAQPKNRERNQVDDLKLRFSTLNDVLQFTIRESGSAYSADAAYLLELARKNHNPNSLGPQRFLQDPGNGHAGLQRVDVKLFDSTPMTVTAFGFRKEVDRSYMSFASAQAKDEFATPDQTGGTTGAKVRLGALSLTSSYGNYERTSGVDSTTTTRQDHTLAWDTSDLRNRLPDFGLGFVSPFVPTSLSVTRFDSQTPVATGEPGVSERTSGYAANAEWKWSSGYGNASYWDYRLDDARTGALAYGFAGRGFDAGFGTYGAALGVYGGVTHYRSDDVSPLWNSITGGSDAYATLTYKFDDLPDLSLNGTLGQYDCNALASATPFHGVYWSATVGLDFSKWLRSVDGAAKSKTPDSSAAAESSPAPGPTASRFSLKSPLGDKLSLKFFYRYAAESAEDPAGGHATDSHLFGAAFRGGL
jgi:hypothetical protein